MQKDTVYRPFVPMLMLAASVAVWMGFSTMQLMQQRDALQAAGEKQQILVDKSTKLRTQLGNIGEQLVKLRDQGNPGATDILAQLQKAGIKLEHKAKTGAEDSGNTPQ